MKKIFFTVVGIFQIIFFVHCLAFAQAADSLKLTDGSKLQIAANRFDNKIPASEKIDSFKITKKEAIVSFLGGNKAGYMTFPGKLPAAALRKNSRLFGEIDKITTAYVLKQGESEFSIGGLNSIKYEKLIDCDECEVKAGLVILEFRAGGKSYYLPFIESIEKLRAGKPKEIIFTDGSSQSVIPFDYQAGKAQIEQISEKEFTATFRWKSVASTVFSDEIIKEISKKKPQLAIQVKKTYGVYVLRQDSEDLAFSTLERVNLKIYDGVNSEYKVKCKAIIVKIIGDGTEKNVLIIKSMRKIKESK